MEIIRNNDSCQSIFVLEPETVFTVPEMGHGNEWKKLESNLVALVK